MSYIVPDDIYAEGILEADYPEDDVQALIDLWQEYIEHATGQFFEDKECVFRIDGSGCESLWFQVPIISLTSLYINSDFDNAIPLDEVEVYNRVPPTAIEDDRKNPRISFIKDTSDIYRSIPLRIFSRGHLNQKVSGHFGFVESEGETPARIKWILKKLVINNLGKLGDPGSGVGVDPMAGLKRSEATDGHSISYGSVFGGGGPKRTDFLDVVQDPVINGILRMFKAPRKIAMIYSDIVEEGL